VLTIDLAAAAMIAAADAHAEQCNPAPAGSWLVPVARRLDVPATVGHASYAAYLYAHGEPVGGLRGLEIVVALACRRDRFGAGEELSVPAMRRCLAEILSASTADPARVAAQLRGSAPGPTVAHPSTGGPGGRATGGLVAMLGGRLAPVMVLMLDPPTSPTPQSPTPQSPTPH
jgi:hypothetical protein